MAGELDAGFRPDPLSGILPSQRQAAAPCPAGPGPSWEPGWAPGGLAWGSPPSRPPTGEAASDGRRRRRRSTGAAPRAGPRRSSPGPRGGRTRNASAPRFRRRTRATSREPSDRRKNPPTHHPTRRWRANRPNRPQGPRSVRAPHPPERSRKPAPSATRCIPHDVRPSVRPRLGGVLASSLLTQFPFDGEQIRKQPSTPPFVRSEQAPFVEQ